MAYEFLVKIFCELCLLTRFFGSFYAFLMYITVVNLISPLINKVIKYTIVLYCSWILFFNTKITLLEMECLGIEKDVKISRCEKIKIFVLTLKE